jgi:predicted PhzF superfamily epimerase YddE/YHI9
LIRSRATYKVFHDQDYCGNRVEVLELDSWPTDAQWQQLSQYSKGSDVLGNPRTLAYIGSVDETGAKTRWYQNGREVSFCGSGVVASACVLLEGTLNQLAPPLLAESLTASIFRRPYGFGFSVERPIMEAAKVASWTTDCFAATPIAAAYSGGANGYMILEFEQPVRQLPVKLEVICKHTQRAIIATNRSSQERYDYELRYFAPQYGMDEDMATGSANVLLAEYWYHKLNKHNYIALQALPMDERIGGVMWTSVRERVIEVGGACERCLSQ